MFLFRFEKLGRQTIVFALLLTGIWLDTQGNLYAQSDIFNGYTVYPTGFSGYSSNSFPQAVAIGDLNGNGRNDVVMTTTAYDLNYDDSWIFIYFQTASGQLAPPVRYLAGREATSVVIADLNGDGLNDIAVGKWGGLAGDGIRVFWQGPPGVFTNYTDFATTNAYMICAGDFNNDGLMDLAGIGWDSSKVDVFLQATNGTLAFAQEYTASYDGYNGIAAADVNNDGLTDIVVMNGQGLGANLSILLQTNGGFAPQVNYSFNNTNSMLAQGFAIGDVDGDGSNDVVISSGGNLDATIDVFHQTASGILMPSAVYNAYDIPGAVAIADVNLDGRPDVLVFHDGFGELGLYLQDSANPTNSLGPEQLFSIPFSGSYNPQCLAVGDINSDGKADVVLADNADDGLMVMLNRLPGVYHPLLASPTSFGPVGPAGGPFYPVNQTFALTNVSGSTLHWTLLNPPSWLTVAPSSGTLAAHGSASVVATLTSAANTLSTGVYAPLLQFTSGGVVASGAFNLSVGQPIVLNGGFEEGSFDRWTISGADTNFSDVIRNSQYADSGLYVHSGSYAAVLGPYDGMGFLTQNLRTTPGQAYVLSCWLGNPSGSTPNQFQVQWNGATLFAQANNTNTAWTNLSFLVTATGPSTPLQFGFEDVADYLALDDISVTSVPDSFQSTTWSANQFQLVWNTSAGINYQVQYKTNLLQASWINLATTIMATTNTLTLTDTNASTQRFYRLSLALP